MVPSKPNRDPTSASHRQKARRHAGGRSAVRRLLRRTRDRDGVAQNVARMGEENPVLTKSGDERAHARLLAIVERALKGLQRGHGRLLLPREIKHRRAVEATDRLAFFAQHSLELGNGVVAQIAIPRFRRLSCSRLRADRSGTYRSRSPSEAGSPCWRPPWRSGRRAVAPWR